MYNINYQDDRSERSDVHFQSWPAMHPHQQQQQQHQQQQQQSSQRQLSQHQQQRSQSISKQQLPLQHPHDDRLISKQQLPLQHPHDDRVISKQQLPLQHPHDDRVISKQQLPLQHPHDDRVISKQQQQPGPSLVTVRQRLWVEISDDDSSHMDHLSTFKSDGKSQQTPPLDLSTMEGAKPGSRHIETPLDLSVKPRKRVADTTDYMEFVQSQGHHGDVSMAKRMYMAAPSTPSYSKERPNSMSNAMAQQKPYMSESMIKAKMLQKQQPSSKHSPKRISPQSSSLTKPQQQYMSLQRQHQMQQLQQNQQQRIQQQLSMPPGQFQNSQDGIRSSVSSHQLHKQFYPSMANSSQGVTPSPLSNSSETVALQGFFEPTQRLTVNTGLSRTNYKLGTQTARSPQSVYLGGHSPNLHSNANRQRDLTNLDNPRSQMVAMAQFSPAISSIAGPSSRMELGVRPSVSVSNISQMEMMQQQQQQQLQRQRQMQVHRDHSVVITSVSPASTHSSIGQMVHQEHAGVSHMYDMQRRSEQGILQSKVPFISPQEQISPYSQQQKLQQKFMSNSSSQSVINQEEKKLLYNSARYSVANQPVPMSDLHKASALADKRQVNQSQLGSFSQMNRSPDNVNMFQSKQRLLSDSSVLDSRQRARHQDMHEQEQKYRMSMSEGMDRSYPDKLGHHISPLRRDVHPSVIQKPQGFIPPRIVSGSGRTSTSSGGIGDQNKSVSDIPLSRYGQDKRPVKSSDQVSMSLSIENLYRRNSSDSLPRTIPHESKHVVSHICDDSTVQRNTVPRHKNSSSINTYNNRDLKTHSQMFQQSKLQNAQQRGVSSNNNFQRLDSNDSQTVQVSKSDNIVQINLERTRPRVEHHEKKLTDAKDKNVMMSALSGCMISPQVPRKQSERSITKGTSGMKKDIATVDLFSHIVLRELKKSEEASSVNPFANRSILQEFDRSRISPLSSKSEQISDESNFQPIFMEQHTKGESQMSNDSSSMDYPLHISIPANKSSAASLNGQTVDHNSCQLNAKQQDTRSKSPKILSRKQMILRAFKQEEDMKNTVNIDKDQKIPMESHKFASSKRSEKDLISQSNFPPSPKMPILSPQERNRATPLVSQGPGDPPNLEATSVSSANHTTALCSNQSKTTSEINSFEEHLHKLISDAVKGSVNKDKDSVYESVCRELTTQPQGKVFIKRQLSQNKNIPVANVAPIVHGRNIPESVSGRQETKIKANVELDEEDKKLAAVVTRSLFDSSYNMIEEKNGQEKQDIEKKEITKIDPSTDITVARAIVEADFKSKMDESVFDEESNATKRMSPGLKKLMLYRHRDITDSSQDCLPPATDSDHSLTQMSDTKPAIQPSSIHKDNHKEVEAERNVFGTFNEILAQKCGGKVENDLTTASWSEVKMEDEELNIQMVPNTDYDGDDDEDTKDLKKLPRRSRKSSVKQQADRLIKKARHRRQSEGKSPTSKCREKPESLSPVKQKVILSSQESKNSVQGKARKRRSSSLDRDTKKKRNTTKSKQICYSDHEIEKIESHVTNDITNDNWHDESTDEDYFQNYQEEFKQTESGTLCKSRDSADNPPAKKVNANKKRKGFHFKQKYIFQRKRKSKTKSKGVVVQEQNADGNVDQNFNFNEGVQSYSPIPFGCTEIGFYDNIPIPPDVKRLAVNKDTGETLLHRAARMGHEEVALYCLAAGSVDVNARDNAGYTALHECCVRGQQEIARILLKHGADVNCCSVDGIRPIHDAVEIDQIEMVRLLLSFGADPTLSTYAGRSLLKIARSERMKKFLHDYLSDLNGFEPETTENLWNFEASNTQLDSEETKGCLLFNEPPSDPEEEAGDLCTLSSKPLFVNRRLAPEQGKRVEDYVLLDDILTSYNVTRKELDNLGISAHLIKRLSVHTLQETLADSVFMEYFTSKVDQDSVPALRAVDASQLMAKLEKYSQPSAKKTKA